MPIHSANRDLCIYHRPIHNNYCFPLIGQCVLLVVNKYTVVTKIHRITLMHYIITMMIAALQQ